jgi:ribokinase
MVVSLPKLPGPGETVLGGKFLLADGGKGANQAVAAARLGAEVTLVARLGTDIFGDKIMRSLESEGVGTDLVVRDQENPSGVALIMVEKGGENVIAVAPGSNYALGPQDVDAARERIEQADVLLLQLEIPVETVTHAVDLAARCGVQVILNPAPAQCLDRNLLKKVTVLTPNRQEARFLAEFEPDEDAAFEVLARRLRGMGPAMVAITLGAAGAFLLSSDDSGRVPSPKVNAVDSTAAGDAFNGALAFALGSGKQLREAVEFANRAGALASTCLGAQPSLPSLEKVLQLS